MADVTWLRHLFVALAVCLALFAAQSTSALAQPLASLIADDIRVDPSGRIAAEGDVEVFFDGTRLKATALTYDSATDRLYITGPITVDDGAGTIFQAEAAELDSDLRHGILTSARLVLNRELQMAAAEIARIGNRYTQLSRVVASSCQVCASNPTPLWEIRASRVVHDTEARQLYFENAQFRLAGVPVVYLPRLRLPDPSLERASGFLIPSLRTSSALGTGVKLPYFVAIGDHADLTLTPYVSSKTGTLEFAYQQYVRNGEINIVGAATRDDLEGTRGYLFADGRLRLARGFVADAQFEFVSDPGYLFSYDYSNKDRLTNSIGLSRTRDKDLFRTRLIEFRTLRDSEIPIRDTLPDRYAEIYYEREMPSLSFGGRTFASFDASTINRPSSTDGDGRDVSRVGVGLNWHRTDLASPGIVLKTELGLRAESFNVGQDSSFARNSSRVIPRAAFELRWPFSRQTRDGGQEVLEPIARLDIAKAASNAVPLEDSRIIEFDEANLFAFSRYPGSDGVEDGVRAALGLAWHRNAPSGWYSDLVVGRVAQIDGGSLVYSEGSGLTGDQSEWLLSARLGNQNGFSLTSRTLFDDNVTFTLSETRVDWRGESATLGSSVVFAQPEPAEGRDDKLSEWTFEGSLELNDAWTARSNWRYDFTAGRSARTGLGLQYRNECIDVDLSLSRRYATSTSVDPTTDFGFRVSLLGVGNGTAGRSNRHKCRG